MTPARKKLQDARDLADLKMCFDEEFYRCLHCDRLTRAGYICIHCKKEPEQ